MGRRSDTFIFPAQRGAGTRLDINALRRSPAIRVRTAMPTPQSRGEATFTDRNARRRAKMKRRRWIVLLCLGGLAAIAVHADDKAPAVPKPRPRLGSERSREINRAGGKAVVGDVQTIEKQFLNTFQSYVAVTYNQLTSKLPDEPSIHARYDIQMSMNTETNEALDIKIVGNLSERRRLLLLQAISHACRAVACPIELRRKYGKVLNFSFDLVVSVRSGKR